MDFERSIEHLLKLHARAEARMDRAEARMDRAELRMDRAELRMDRTDRQIEAIRKIIKTGMKLIVRIEAAQVRTDAKVEKLAEIWLKRPPNGHPQR
jgi:chromosome segregation ATPase